MLRLTGLKTVKHYVVLGAYLGAIFFVVQLFRQSREVEKAFSQGWVFATFAFAGLLLGCTLFGAGIGWLIGRLQANSK